MGWLGRLLGKQPPLIPAGGRAYVAQDDLNGEDWSVRVVLGDDAPTHRDKRISPTFHSQIVAEAYLAWCTGEAASFTYPADGAA